MNQPHGWYGNIIFHNHFCQWISPIITLEHHSRNFISVSHNFKFNYRVEGVEIQKPPGLGNDENIEAPFEIFPRLNNPPVSTGAPPRPFQLGWVFQMKADVYIGATPLKKAECRMSCHGRWRWGTASSEHICQGRPRKTNMATWKIT